MTSKSARVEALRVPMTFTVGWTEKMVDWLNDQQGLFSGAWEWCDWIVSITPQLCESWGSKSKPWAVQQLVEMMIDGVKDMLAETVAGQDLEAAEFIENATDLIEEWAEN